MFEVGEQLGAGMIPVSPQAGHAASRLGRVVNRSLAGSELRPPEYRLLAHLVEGGESAAADLARKLAVSRPSVTATVDGLVRKGLVVKTGDPTDGRRIRIMPTSSGRAALSAADAVVTQRLAEVLSHLGDDASSVAGALELLLRALDDDRQARNARFREAQS